MQSHTNAEANFNAMKISGGILIFLWLCINVNAQQVLFLKSGSRIGLTIGTAYNTQVKTKDSFFPLSYSYYNRFSPDIGFCFKDSLNKFLNIKIGASYLQRGVKFDYSYNFPGAYNLHSVEIYTGHYLTIPVRLNVMYKGFYIGAGVEASILLTHHDYDFLHTDLGTPNTIVETKVKKNYGYPYYQPADVGYSFAVGYQYRRFEIEANMFHGLIIPRLYPYFSSQHFEFQYAYQQTFALTISYYPMLKKGIPNDRGNNN